MGVDIACTKISIDLQNMRRGSIEPSIRDSLNSLRDSSGVDTAFVWLFSADGSTIDEVYAWDQARSQGLVIEVDHPVLGPIELPGPIDGPALRFLERDAHPVLVGHGRLVGCAFMCVSFR